MLLKVGALIKKVRLSFMRRRKLNDVSLIQKKVQRFSMNNEFSKLINCVKRGSLQFFISYQQRKETARIFKELFSNESENLIKNADEICNHIFDLLGSGKVNLGKKINWHCDFKSGYCWDIKTFYLDIEYGDKEGVDIKVPWELSRFQHLATLGEAYWLTGDEKYTREFMNEIEDWIKSNLPGYGVNWRCAMDVAIRACNWILGFYFFKDSKEVNNEFLIKFLKSLFIHGKHIERNLEKSWRGFTSNHYLSDIVGLVYLGGFFRGNRQGKKWLDFGIRELKREMKKQVYPDGVDFEASTCYHRLVLELFFYPTLFIIKNSSYFSKNNFVDAGEKVFGKDYIKKLYKMFEFILFSLKPNGKMPQLGDNDNGRLHIFGSREVLDMRYLLSLGAVFFKEPKFKIKEFGFCEEVLWVFGKDGYDIWNSLESISINSIGSRSFPNAGWYILRKDKNYMIVSCGPNGQNGNGGHAHNDKLSFELCVEGRDILLDPGTYVYTPIPYWRNKFRSTLFHNTVVVDGVEQNRFNDRSLFFLENDAKCKINVWKTTERYDFLDAEHYGYRRLKNPVIHRRQIFYDKNEDYWIVRDLITGEGEHKFDWCFHVAENVIFDIDRNSLAVTINGSINNEKNIELKLIPLNAGGFKFFKVDSWLSYGYGEKVSSIMLGYSKTAVVPIDFIFVIAAKEFKEFSHSKDDIVNLLESHCK